jgi:hypothetical protein
MSELKREFKLLDLMDVWNVQSDISIPFTTPLRPIAEAHQRNVRRVYLLAMFPPTVVNAVGAMAEIRATVKWRHKDALERGSMSQEALFRAIEDEIQTDMTSERHYSHPAAARVSAFKAKLSTGSGSWMIC